MPPWAVSAYELPLVGGDTTRGPLTITVQVFGAVPGGQALLRGGARVGDAVCVSGPLGDAAAGLALLRGEWRATPEAAEYLVDRYNRPRARLELGADWRVKPCEELVAALNELDAVSEARLVY